MHSISIFILPKLINQKAFSRVSGVHSENHGFYKFNPQTCDDCPCALLIVIVKTSRIGDCKRLNSNDISVGFICTRNRSTSSPLNFLIKIVTSWTLFIIFLTESLIPLQRRCGFMLRKRMMGTHAIFNGRTCNGKNWICCKFLKCKCY